MIDKTTADHVREIITSGDMLLIVPPFYKVDQSSLAAHILQACGKKAGIHVTVFYVGLILAKEIGVERYSSLCNLSYNLLGERLFARSAFGGPPLGRWAEEFDDLKQILTPKIADKIIDPFYFPSYIKTGISLEELVELEKQAYQFIEDIAPLFEGMSAPIAGCTTSFEQNSASFALLQRIKKYNPRVTTVIGGSNCEGEMAEGVASLDPEKKVIDYVFSGESEGAFISFLQDFKNNTYPEGRIISGTPCFEMDNIPQMDFSDFFTQLNAFLPETGGKGGKISYETSRGCWWGQKKRCRFCGLAGDAMTYRTKSSKKVIEEMTTIAETYPGTAFDMADNVIPPDFFNSVIPYITEKKLVPEIFYEIRPGMSFGKMRKLRDAGVLKVQVGIESLSSQVLKLMNKGLSPWRNIEFLRHTKTLGIYAHWHILWGFPGEKASEYEKVLNFVPLILHLQPPMGIYHLILTRFSPYFTNPDDFGIKNIRPVNTYRAVYPEWTDFNKIGYMFMADYETETYDNQDIIPRIKETVESWQLRWHTEGSPPMLHISKTGDKYMVLDTRGLSGAAPIGFIDEDEFGLLINHRKYDNFDADTREKADALVEKKLAFILDNVFIPLPTITPELLT